MSVAPERVTGTSKPRTMMMAPWLSLVAAVLSLTLQTSLLMQTVCLGLGAGLAVLSIYRFAMPSKDRLRRPKPLRIVTMLVAAVAVFGFVARYLVILGTSRPVPYADYVEQPGGDGLLQWLAVHFTAFGAISVVLMLASTMVLALVATINHKMEQRQNSM